MFIWGDGYAWKWGQRGVGILEVLEEKYMYATMATTKRYANSRSRRMAVSQLILDMGELSCKFGIVIPIAFEDLRVGIPTLEIASSLEADAVF